MSKKILDIGKAEVGAVIKGKVESIGEPTEVQTKFGKSYRVPLLVKTEDGNSIEVSIFIREKTVQLGVANPRSNLYKILDTYGVKKLSELIGKTVNIRIDSRGFYRLVY